jgi:hypothetical protein
MTPGTKSGGGAEKDKHSAENDENSAENDEIEVPKKSAETGGNLHVTRSRLCVLSLGRITFAAFQHRYIG